MYQEKHEISTELDEKNIPSLSKFKRISFLLNSLAVINLVGVIYLSFYLDLALFLVVASVLPILGFCLIFYSQGIVRPIKNKNSVFPSIFLVFLLSTLVLCIPAISWYGELLDIVIFWSYVSCFGLILFGVYLFSEKKYFKGIKFKFKSLFLLVTFLFYSYGFILNTNKLLDISNPVLLEFGIANRYEENEDFYLELENYSWISGNESNKLKVDKFIYKLLEGKTSIKINTHEGFLGISWFYYDVFD